MLVLIVPEHIEIFLSLKIYYSPEKLLNKINIFNFFSSVEVSA